MSRFRAVPTDRPAIALFVLGFAMGPLLWAPLSEMYGRRLSFAVSYAPFVAFSLGAGFAPNIASLIILRFLAGAFGSSPLTNSGGGAPVVLPAMLTLAVISDMFPARARGRAMTAFALAPFFGKLRRVKARSLTSQALSSAQSAATFWVRHSDGAQSSSWSQFCTHSQRRRAR